MGSMRYGVVLAGMAREAWCKCLIVIHATDWSRLVSRRHLPRSPRLKNLYITVKQMTTLPFAYLCASSLFRQEVSFAGRSFFRKKNRSKSGYRIIGLGCQVAQDHLEGLELLCVLIRSNVFMHVNIQHGER